MQRFKRKVVNLIIDIGNTIAKIAAFDGELLQEVLYTSNQTLEDLSSFSKKYSFSQAIVATVVNLSSEAECALKALTMPLLYLDKDTDLPIINLYGTPQTLGYDRVAAVVGANACFPNRDILVIDAGTCITYEFIDAESRYHGGNISPGIQMRFNALHQQTARLPQISAEGRLLEMGKDTETAIRSGVKNGIKYEIEGYIRTLKYKYPQLLVFLTGGDDISFDTNIKSIIFADRFLVLKGLNRILIYNNDKV